MAKKFASLKSQSLVATPLAQALSQEKTDIRSTITVLKELEDLIPPLQTSEREQLKENIDAEGIREPILLWKNEDKHIVIDGHNRYSIAQELEIKDFPFKVVDDLDSLIEVKDWMILNQLGRRNLSPTQASYLRGQLYNTAKQGHGGTDRLTPSSQNDHLDKKTHERLSEELNVSPKTIQRDGNYAQGMDFIEQANPELKRDILSGAVKVSKSDIEALAKANEVLDKKPQTISSPEDVKKLVTEIKGRKGTKASKPVSVKKAKGITSILFETPTNKASKKGKLKVSMKVGEETVVVEIGEKDVDKLMEQGFFGKEFKGR